MRFLGRHDDPGKCVDVYTYARLANESNRFANVLERLGTSPGESVFVLDGHEPLGRRVTGGSADDTHLDERQLAPRHPVDDTDAAAGEAGVHGEDAHGIPPGGGRSGGNRTGVREPR